MIPVLIAVALSISNPSQYKYSIPVDTNRVTGVGMGYSPLSIQPLNYTDKTFLTELFSERCDFLMESQGYPTTENNMSWLHMFSCYKIAISDLSQYQGHLKDKGYVFKSISPVANTIRALNYDASSGSSQYAWLDIFQRNPFITRSITNDNAFSNGSILSKDVIADIYSDGMNLSRPVFHSLYCSSFSQKNEIESNTGGSSILYYDDVNNSFVYGNDYYTNKTTTIQNYTWSYSQELRAYRQKDVGWKLEYGEWRPKTQITSSSYTSTESYNRQPVDRVYCNSFTTIKIRPYQNVRSCTCYALGYFDHTLKRGNSSVRKSGYFITPVASSINGEYIYLALGGPIDRNIINAIFSVFGVHRYESASELLSDVPEAEDPETVDYSKYRRTYSPEYRDIFWAYLESIYVILEVDFNARTL